jgi:hypothetical protein
VSVESVPDYSIIIEAFLLPSSVLNAWIIASSYLRWAI